ncbi:hypothetical protein [Polyangium fumosum]|nr:hypothetical protein [Polyangium fumosum]
MTGRFALAQEPSVGPLRCGRIPGYGMTPPYVGLARTVELIIE